MPLYGCAGQSILMSILQHHAAAGKAGVGSARHHRPAPPSQPAGAVCPKGKSDRRVFQHQGQANGLEAVHDDGGVAARPSFKRPSADEEGIDNIGQARSTSPAHQCGSCGESQGLISPCKPCH